MTIPAKNDPEYMAALKRVASEYRNELRGKRSYINADAVRFARRSFKKSLYRKVAPHA